MELVIYPAIFYLWRSRGIKAVKADISAGQAGGNPN